MCFSEFIRHLPGVVPIVFGIVNDISIRSGICSPGNLNVRQFLDFRRKGLDWVAVQLQFGEVFQPAEFWRKRGQPVVLKMQMGQVDEIADLRRQRRQPVVPDFRGNDGDFIAVEVQDLEIGHTENLGGHGFQFVVRSLICVLYVCLKNAAYENACDCRQVLDSVIRFFLLFSWNNLEKAT